MPFQPFSIARLASPANRSMLTAVLVMAALILPWMSPIHPAPLADWFTDAMTLFFIGLAALVASIGAPQQAITRTSLLAWGMVLLIALLNFINKPVYLVQSWMPVGTFLAMVLLAGVVRDLTATPESRRRFIDILAGALLLSALVQSVIGFMQHVGLAHHFGMWVVHQPGASSSTVMGNISQRNVFGHMLALGVVSACWIYCRGLLRLRWVVPMVAFIALIQSWCGSRLVVAYALGLIALSAWWWFRARGDAMVRRFGTAAGIAALLILGMQFVGLWAAHILAQYFDIGAPIDPGGRRLFAEVSMGSGSRRISEWSKALDAFLHHPLLGVGWGGFAANSAYLEAYSDYVKAPDNTLCLHAHNLLVQLLVETGLVGTALAVGGIVWCLLPSLRRASADSAFLLGLAMVSLIHSQFEYPLWYLTGLATFVVVLACASPEPVAVSVFKPVARRFAAILMGSLLVIHAVTGFENFRTISIAFSSPPESWSPQTTSRINTLQHHPLWSFESELVLAIHLVPFGEPMKAKRELLERAASYRPYGPVLLKLAIMRQLQGEEAKAKQAIDMLVAGFPDLVRPFFAYVNALPVAEIQPVRDWMKAALDKRAAPAAAQ